MIRPVAKLGEVSGHPLLADMNVGAAHRRLEQPPEAFNAVCVEGLAGPANRTNSTPLRRA